VEIQTLIRDIPDFPKEGIIFKDITPLLADPAGFRTAVDTLAKKLEGVEATKIVAAEARGFIFGAALAYKLGLGFVPIRKPGKLPHKALSVTYELEYGTDTLCMHEDAVERDESVIVVDDLLATGGTIGGVLELLGKAGASAAAIVFLIELDFLKGREKFGEHRTISLIHYDGE
jgi:adenine phosphoribosyltransferase